MRIWNISPDQASEAGRTLRSKRSNDAEKTLAASTLVSWRWQNTV